MNRKINQAVKKGDLIDYDDLFASYSQKRQQEILKRARYLKAAMELKKLRKELKISQEELARKMGTGQAVISRLEGANASPSLSLIKRLANALGLKVELRFTPR